MPNKIGWCDQTVNFVTGCVHGCSYCWARKMAHRLSRMPGTVYHAMWMRDIDPFSPAYHFSVYQEFVERTLSNTRSRGKRIFLSSMGDVGCDVQYRATVKDSDGKYHLIGSPSNPEAHYVNLDYVLERLGVVGNLCDAGGHTCLILTKNPGVFTMNRWPRSMHIGTSVDSVNDETKKRVDDLSRVGASVRWLSIEPLLDPKFNMDALCGEFLPDWVVVGGLSGREEIPYDCVRAALGIGDWCTGHKIPIYYKHNLEVQFQGVVWRREFPGGAR